MRRPTGYLRVWGTKIWRALSATLWPPDLIARIAIVAAFISVIGALGTVVSALFAGDQALSARLSAKAAEEAVPYARASAEAAIETLRRSDEDLLIIVDVNSQAPVAVSLTASDESSSFSIKFSATAVIINRGGSPAVVTDRIVATYVASDLQTESRSDIFDASTGVPWPNLAVIRPNEPLRLSLIGHLYGDNHHLPTVTKALTTLFDQHELQNGSALLQFGSLSALHDQIHRHAADVENEFESFLYGPATKPGTVISNPWSEEEEAGYSRIILKISTASRRAYRSSPGLMMGGPDPHYGLLMGGAVPGYSIPEIPR